MVIRCTVALAAISLAWVSPGTHGATTTAPRYGAADFVPTPQQPIGFQADGSGWYPGAKLEVLEWWDGKPGWAKVGSIGDAKPADRPVFLDKTPKNILWKVPLPGHAGNHPIVVGDRVIATIWPDYTICYDRITGKELWRDRLMATALPVLSAQDGRTLGRAPDAATARKNEILYGMGCAMVYLRQGLRTPTEGEDPGPADYPRVKVAVERMGEWRRTLEDSEPALIPLLDQEISLAKRFLAGEHAILGASPQKRKEIEEKLDGELHKSLPQFGDPWGFNANMFYASKKSFTGEIMKLTGLSLNTTAWGSMLSLQLAAPASDGTIVVVRFANGQLGAYDIATGKRLWAWRDPWCNTGWTWHCFSPRIHGDAVFINLMGGHRPKQAGLYCVEVKTGVIRWSLPHKQGPSAVHGNSYPITTPVTMEIADGAGGTMTIVVNCGGEIVSAKDGKVLHRFPEAHHLSACYPFAFGNLLFAPGLEADGNAIDGSGKRETAVYQPRMEQGALRMPILEIIPLLTYYGVSVCNDRMVIGGNKGHFYDRQTKTLGPLGREHMQKGLAIIGDRFLYMSPDNSNRRFRLDGITTENFELFDAQPHPYEEALRLVSNRSILGGADHPSDIYYDTWLKGIDKLPLMQARYTGFGNPLTAYFGHTMSGPVAAGNRMYVQGACHLYCIGPAVKGTPADDPAVVAAIRAEAEAAKLLTRLADASAQYRFEAVKRLGALKAPFAKEMSDRLATLAVDDPYEEIRAAAVLALGAADPQGRAGWDRLMADYAVNFWSEPPPKEGWAYHQDRERTERRQWVQMTLRVLGEQGRTRLERDYEALAKDPLRLRIVLDLATSQRWRIEPLVKAGLEVAQRGPLAKTKPWAAQVPVNTSNASCLLGYFAAIDAASDPAIAEILLKAYPKNWTLYPTFARNLKPESLLAWIEPIAMESANPSNRPSIFNAWKTVGKAALPCLERVKAAMLAKGEADKPAADYAKAIEETIAIIKEK
jgi:hypothetical protein